MKKAKYSVNLVKPAPIPAGSVVPRTRAIGRRYPCPKCDGDGFVIATRRYPSVIEATQRIRLLKCGSCGFNWKSK